MNLSYNISAEGVLFNDERQVKKMKNNMFFIFITMALLLASSIVLTGSMHAIAAKREDSKTYIMDSRISDKSMAMNNTPMPQTELQEKFSAMYEFSEDGKSVTVISEDYLNNYWQSNFETEQIHSLTAEEVFFLVQDSIRLYNEYETVVLLTFDPVSSDEQVFARFPHVVGKSISTLSEQNSIDWDKVESDIHAIILYRLTALSSPNAFFTGADAILSSGGYPEIYSSMYPETLFYIPGYSSDTERNTILSNMGNGYTPELIVDLFIVSVADDATIKYWLSVNGEKIPVFPTDEMIYSH